MTSRINANSYSSVNYNTDEVLRSKNLTFGNDATNSISGNNVESEFLRSNFLTTKTETRGCRQYLPFVFTEQGVYMLMTVLKGELTDRQVYHPLVNALLLNPVLSLN